MVDNWLAAPPDANGLIRIPKWEHTYDWSEWSDWFPREGYPNQWQRTRECRNGCGIDVIQTEYREPKAEK